ncbi:hypothetical protein OH492_15100 [Vibrio chagasii]|nr:hypothetical protein [Vibrio chagasii]
MISELEANTRVMSACLLLLLNVITLKPGQATMYPGRWKPLAYIKGTGLRSWRTPILLLRAGLTLKYMDVNGGSCTRFNEKPADRLLLSPIEQVM